jgi:hypothetical protein
MPRVGLCPGFYGRILGQGFKPLGRGPTCLAINHLGLEHECQGVGG